MLQKYIDGQYRRPAGLVGRWIGRNMANQHLPENLWTVAQLNVQPTDQVLEVGFGPGLAIRAVASHLVKGQVAGVDYSRIMVNVASKRNARDIRAGRVRLQFGDAANLPYDNALFDKAKSIHCIYFWPQPLQVFGELARVIKPGGMLVITVLPKERWGGNDPSAQVGTPECTPYSGETIAQMVIETGFSAPLIQADSVPEHASNYSVIAIR